MFELGNEFSFKTYDAQWDAGFQNVEEIFNVEIEFWVQGVEPLGQIFLHGNEIFFRRLEGPKRPGFQKYRRHFRSRIFKLSAKFWNKPNLQKLIEYSVFSIQMKPKSITVYCLYFCSNMNRFDI